MKLKLLIIVFLGLTYNTNAQTGIGTLAPNPSARLDVDASDKGVLIPRVALTGTLDQTTIVNGNVESLLVFNTTDNSLIKPGYYYWSDGSWKRFISKGDDELQEPWKIQNTSNDAANNTDNIYQAGKVAVGFTDADAVSDKQLEVKGDFKTETLNNGIYHGLITNSEDNANLLYTADVSLGADFSTNFNSMTQGSGYISSLNGAAIFNLYDDVLGQVSLGGNAVSLNHLDTQTNDLSSITVRNEQIQISNTKSNSATSITVESGLGIGFFNAGDGEYRFPTTRGNANQVLTTDGASGTDVAQLSWKDVSDDDAWINDTANARIHLGTLSDGVTPRANNFQIGDNGHVAFGEAAVDGLNIGGSTITAHIGLNFDETVTATDKSLYAGQFSNLNLKPSGTYTGSPSVYGNINVMRKDAANSNAYANFYVSDNEAIISGGGTITNLTNDYMRTEISSASATNITSFTGTRDQLQLGGGNHTIGTVVGYDLGYNLGSGSATNVYGFKSLLNNSNKTVDNTYGVYSSVVGTSNTSKTYRFYAAGGSGTGNSYAFVSEPGAGKVGVGTIAPTNQLHVVATENPVKLEGLQPGSATDKVVVVDANGVLKTKDAGAASSSIVKVVTNYTVLPTDSTILANATAAGFTLTLPTAASSMGRILTIRRTDTTNNVLTVSEAIKVSEASSLTTIYSVTSIRIQSDGTDWYYID